MSVTVLSDVIAPNSIWSSGGVRGKQMRRNDRAQTRSGNVLINQVWSRTLRTFEIGTIPLAVDVWQTIEGLFEVTEGGTKGFLMFDPKDSICTDSTGKVTSISGSPSNTYQLVQRKTAVGSSRTKDRNITRPQASSFILKISGTPTLSYTLNADTGIVTIPANPSASLVTWSGNFYVPVQFANDEIDWELVVSGSADSRLLAGPTVSLVEIKE